jgi:hypothetical protein
VGILPSIIIMSNGAICPGCRVNGLVKAKSVPITLLLES